MEQIRAAHAAFRIRARRRLSGLAAAMLLAAMTACGGGNEPAPLDSAAAAKRAPAFGSAKVANSNCDASSAGYRRIGADCLRVTDVVSTRALARADGAGPLAAPTASVTPDAAFNWAEANYPNYFPSAGKIAGYQAPFAYRFYPATQTYIGISTGNPQPAVYLYGALTGWEARYFAPLVDLTCAIAPQSCVVTPSSASLTMTAYEGASQTASFTVAYPPVPGTLAVQPALATPWLSAVIEGTDSVKVTAAASGLEAGAYSSNVKLTFTASTGESYTSTVPISLTVGAGLVAPANIQVTLDGNSTPQSLSGSVQVSRADGGTTTTWTASSSQPWLVLAAAGGTTGSPLSYSVNAIGASSVANNSDATAVVTIGGTNLTPVSFQVVLHKHVPQLTAVLPYGIVAATQSRVVVGGSGFLQLANPSTAVQVQGQTISSVQVISDTQLTFKVTPPSAGTFAVTVTNGAVGTPVNLLVIADNALPVSSIAHDGEMDNYVYDPVRKAIYATTWMQNALYRYQYKDGAWTVKAKPLTQPFEVGISADGKRLFVALAEGSLKELDPETLDIVTSYATPIHDGYGYHPLALTSDNRLWLPSNYYSGSFIYFDLNDNTVKTLDSLGWGVQTADFIASRDGTVMLTLPDYCCSPRGAWHAYRSSDTTVSTPMGGIDIGYWAKTNGDGTRNVDGSTGKVYDAGFNLLGQLPDPASGESYARIAITPDGRRLIVMIDVGYYDAFIPRLDVYDATLLAPGTTRYVKIGSMPTPTISASCPNSDHGCDPWGELIPSVDNKSVIWIGNKKLQVFKLP